MRRVFQNDVARQFSLQRGTVRFQFIDHTGARYRAKNTYEDVGVLQVGRNVDSIDADQHAFEVYLACNDCAQLTFYEFV